MAKQATATQKFVPIKDIRDGVIQLKDGGMRMIIMVSSMNFALKSEDEQTGVLLQFQNFLNTLDFSAQIFIQSRRLDIKPYLESLEERMGKQESELIKIQTREYLEFVRNFTDSVNIMSKSFFVVIPYTGSGGSASSDGSFSFLGFGGGSREQKTEEESFEARKMQLEQRAIIVEQGLTAVGLRSARLGSEELIELFYKIFNPADKSGAPSAEMIDQ